MHNRWHKRLINCIKQQWACLKTEIRCANYAQIIWMHILWLYSHHSRDVDGERVTIHTDYLHEGVGHQACDRSVSPGEKTP